MNKATEEVLRKALESKKKRFDKLDALMSKRHTSQADCKAHDEIAKRFNACKDIDEKMRIAIELKPISDRIKKQFRMSGIQNDNYMKWMGEQDKLRSEIWQLENSLSLCDFRRFLSADEPDQTEIKRECKTCEGHGLVEIQSGPYSRRCDACQEKTDSSSYEVAIGTEADRVDAKESE